MVLGIAPRILLLGSAPERLRAVGDALQTQGLPTDHPDGARPPTSIALDRADVLVCVLDPNEAKGDADHWRALLSRARAENLAALVWGVPAESRQPDGLLTEYLAADVGLDEVVQRLTALARYAPLIRRMEKELQRLEQIGQHLNRYFEEIDREMRLAGRLQRDFLPHKMPDVSTLKFAHLYRPAAWVSGDIFDVFKLGERHVGVFVADAMGHGTAAGLMSMFLRKALVPTRFVDSAQVILTPVEAMRQLHVELARQTLPDAQFVTATYAIIDTESLELCLARGGHPYPLHISPSGAIRELRCDGGLLGVGGLDPEFDQLHGRLSPGDKVVFYTDGLEDVFIDGRDEEDDKARFTEDLLSWAALDGEAFTSAISRHLDQQEGSLNPADDVTVVIVEVAS